MRSQWPVAATESRFPVVVVPAVAGAAGSRKRRARDSGGLPWHRSCVFKMLLKKLDNMVYVLSEPVEKKRREEKGSDLLTLSREASSFQVATVCFSLVVMTRRNTDDSASALY